MDGKSWSDLDVSCKVQILSILSAKELCILSAVSHEDHQLAAEPLIWQRKLVESFGVSVKGLVAGAYKALYIGLSERKVGTSTSCTPGTTYPVRFQALYTDGGVDGDLYKQYWADLAFEANKWGAYCSKVSPDVNVLGLIQTPSEKEQAAMQHRAFLADRCRWAAGRMLARVPLPPMDAPPTKRQSQYFAKAGAILLRWSTPALERLYCILYASRSTLEPIGRALELGFTGPTAPESSSSTTKSMEALLRSKYAEILQARLKPETAAPFLQTNESDDIQVPIAEFPQLLQALSGAYAAAAEDGPIAAGVGELPEEGGSGVGQTGGGIDPRDLASDQGLKVVNRKLAQKLARPADLASHAAVMDMITISRAGNEVFTCPVRTGAVLLGSVTSASPPLAVPSSVALSQQDRDFRMQAYMGSITSQPSCSAFDDLNTAEAVFGAVSAGKAPRIVQYKLMPHFEYIEFERSTDAPTVGKGGPPVVLQPIIWYRFFTSAEQEYLSAVERERRAMAGSRGTYHWGCIAPWNETAFLAHLQQQQQQQQGRRSSRLQSQDQSQQQRQGQQKASRMPQGKGRGKEGSSSAQQQPAASTSSKRGQGRKAAALQVPPELVVLNAAGQLEVLDVQHVLAPGVSISMHQGAFGWGLMKAQEELDARRREHQQEQDDFFDVAGGGHAGMVGNSGSNSSEDDASSGDLMEEDLQQLQETVDASHDAMMGMEPPEDVNDLLAMMGYDHGGEGEMHDDDDDDEGEDSSSSEPTSSEGEEEGGGHAPASELGDRSQDEDEMEHNLMQMEEEEEFDVAAHFPDIIDPSPPPTSERLLLTLLAQNVGLQLLMNTHTELERESQLIVEQEMGLRMRALGQSAFEAGDSQLNTFKSQKDTKATTGSKASTQSPQISEVMHLLPGDETAQDSTALDDHITNSEILRHPGLMQARLLLPRAGNMLCLKLISPENKMTEMSDPHDEPNVDLQFAAFRGVSVQLRQGLQMTQ